MLDRKPLPKLPKGMGGYSYTPEGKIRFRKQITYRNKISNLSVTGNSIAEVNKLMAEKESSINNQKALDSGSAVRTLQDSMYDWLMVYKINEVAPRSFDRIMSTFNSQINNSTLGKQQEPSITSFDIQTFLNNLTNIKTKEPLSYSSKKKVYELINQYFRFKYVQSPSDNPMLVIKPPIKSVTNVDDELIIYNDDEIKQFMKEAEKPLVVGKGGYRYGLLLTFIMWSVLRIGEARALLWEDVDLENKTIKVNKAISPIKNRENGSIEHTVTKTKNRKNRIVPMPQPAFDAISKYKSRVAPASDKEYIFAQPNNPYMCVTNTSIERAYNTIVKRAHLDYKHVTVHGLRHTGISALLRGGVPIEVVSRMAGHQSIQITTDIYYSVLEEQKESAIREFKFD